jgi:hypothetical protein
MRWRIVVSCLALGSPAKMNCHTSLLIARIAKRIQLPDKRVSMLDLVMINIVMLLQEHENSVDLALMLVKQDT